MATLIQDPFELGPTIVLFHSSLLRSRSVRTTFIADFKGMIICDGYSAYGNSPHITYANCWAHARRYWHQADSKQGQIGVDYCDQLYHLERQYKKLRPGKRRKARQKHSKPIVEKFFKWINEYSFFWKSALAKVAAYTLKRMRFVPMSSIEKIGCFL